MQGEQLTLFDDFGQEEKLLCPFVGRKVSVTGTFSLGRQALRSKLLKFGASDVRFDSLQRNTHFLLVGESPSTSMLDYWRLYVHDGYNIRRISFEDLEEIERGNYAPYQTEAVVCKKLHLTKEHLYWSAPEIEGLKNIRTSSPLMLESNSALYGKEIYIHLSLAEQMPELPQLLGCLGAYANVEMDEKTDLIIMQETMPALVCHGVEEYYNSSRATQFDIPFLLLEDLLLYIQKRLEQFPDIFMQQLYEKMHKTGIMLE
ncbi:MAG: hypothetical protein IKU79_01755 [Bacteroidaceae bacterium]|nr:hypothetical protein [Bacteroidaceae bacterium]